MPPVSINSRSGRRPMSEETRSPCPAVGRRSHTPSAQPIEERRLADVGRPTMATTVLPRSHSPHVHTHSRGGSVIINAHLQRRARFVVQLEVCQSISRESGIASMRRRAKKASSGGFLPSAVNHSTNSTFPIVRAAALRRMIAHKHAPQNSARRCLHPRVRRDSPPQQRHWQPRER